MLFAVPIRSQADQLKQWHRLYYALAAFNLLTILASLVLTHILLKTHGTEVDVNGRWVAQFETFDRLRNSASLVNAPGNDVFESRDADGESRKFEENLKTFAAEIQSASQNIQSVINLEQKKTLLANLALVSDSMQGMASAARLVFSEFKKGNISRAALSMARMDRKYSEINKGLNDLRIHARGFQKLQLNEQRDRARVLGQFEYFFGGMACLFVILIALYGYAVSSRIRKTRGMLEEQQAKILAASKMATLGEMAGGIAHEINNPLAIIHMQSLLLKEMGKSGQVSVAQVVEAAEMIEHTSERITSIVKGLRAFARDGANDPFRFASLGSIVEDTLRFCREKFKNQDLSLKVDLPAKDISVQCRSTEISQVVLNLISNASEAIEKQKNPWIQIQLNTRDGQAELSVTDSGPGIPQEIQAKLMQPFFTTKEIGRGMGLGLSISKGIAESHGGKLYLDTSVPNTRFVLLLPLPQRNAVT